MTSLFFGDAHLVHAVQSQLRLDVSSKHPPVNQDNSSGSVFDSHEEKMFVAHQKARQLRSIYSELNSTSKWMSAHQT